MSQPMDDSDDEMQVAFEVSKDNSHDANSIKALRRSLQEAREREGAAPEKKAPEKEATRKGKRKEFEVVEVAGRVAEPESEAAATQQAFRKAKVEIDLISDEEEAPVAAVGDGKKRAGAGRDVYMWRWACVWRRHVLYGRYKASKWL